MTQNQVDAELEREIDSMSPCPALGNQMYLRPEQDVQAQIKAIAKRKRVKDQVVVRALLRLGLRRQAAATQ